MKTKVNNRLFWYLKDGIEFDLENPSHVDMYVQQILSHGKAEDIQKMLEILPPEKFRKSFKRIRRFLRREAGLGDTGEDS